MRRAIIGILCLTGIVAFGDVREARAQEHEHDAADHTHDGLHFTHPLIAESVTPDTKIRLDHQFLSLPGGGRINFGNLEAEYAFSRSFSIETSLPYSYTDSELGNLEVALKFANFEFEDSGVLLGYGIEFGFPTAGELGEAEWELAPFLNIGYKRGDLELVAWGIFGIPFSQEEGEQVATEISYNLAGLYHVSPRFDAILELDGAGGISGHTVGEDVVNLSPGARFRPFANKPFIIGTSVGFPLSHEEQFTTRWTTSLFWHF